MTYKSYSCFISGKEKIWRGLPNREQQILQSVLMHDSSPRQRVSDVLHLRELGSQATLHAALMRLKTSHFLALTTDTKDHRVKFKDQPDAARLQGEKLRKGKLFTKIKAHQKLTPTNATELMQWIIDGAH